MILDLFSLPIYKVKLEGFNLELIKDFLKDEFERSSYRLSPLEKNGGVSTYSTNNQLHNAEPLAELTNEIKKHIQVYWKILGIDDRLYPTINQCWANIHKRNSITLQHSHSLMPIVATFYVQADPGSGGLVLTNPMEYGLTHIPFSTVIEDKIETIINIETCNLILFPGWIRHKTEENLSNSDRIVLSYNVVYGGNYLDTDSKYPDISKAEPANSEVNYLRNQVANLEFIIDNLKRNLHGA